MRFTELIKEAVTSTKNKIFSNEAVLDYVRGMDSDFSVDKHVILTHPTWALRQVPIDHLQMPTAGNKIGPYHKRSKINHDYVKSISADGLAKKPIVIDSEGYIIDGNHRAMAAQMNELTTIPAYAPVEALDEAGLYYKGYPCTQDCGGHMAGYAWAERKGINDEDYCGGSSNSFWEGCKSKTEGR